MSSQHHPLSRSTGIISKLCFSFCQRITLHFRRPDSQSIWRIFLTTPQPASYSLPPCRRSVLHLGPKIMDPLTQNQHFQIHNFTYSTAHVFVEHIKEVLRLQYLYYLGHNFIGRRLIFVQSPNAPFPSFFLPRSAPSIHPSLQLSVTLCYLLPLLKATGLGSAARPGGEPPA